MPSSVLMLEDLRMPTALYGVVGLKPSFESHTTLVIPWNWTVGMVGILAGTVEDSLITYTAIKGEGETRQPTTSGGPARLLPLIDRYLDVDTQNRPSFDDIITKLDLTIMDNKRFPEVSVNIVRPWNAPYMSIVERNQTK
ncbi:fatty acid amide hydrolase [Artemisia annua]|uniref:Fatty acid amide hydrolase n=1 Tax=Artemisia annua TaxID=35608 RepID=A0A2U1LV16_ARTAN|nr:fatty acid amide hydrolase [Artemisia annua]